MNTKLFPILVFVLLLATSGSAYWCYQETATTSTACGGLATGAYESPLLVDYWYDGSWTSWDTHADNHLLYVNYTKPTYAQNDSLLQLKWGTPGVNQNISNITIPKTCWNQTSLQFRFNITTSYGMNLSCYNGTTNIYLKSINSFGIYNQLAEEAMWWDIIDLSFDTCGNFTNPIANFSLFQEDVPTITQNGTISATISASFSTTNSNLSFSIPNTNKIRLCMNYSNPGVIINLYLQSITNPGFTHRFYLNNYFLNGTEQAFQLYNFNYTTGISLLQLTVRDYLTDRLMPNILVKLQRFYPGTGTWLTVQEYQTDTFGIAIFNILEQLADYRFIFLDLNNNVLATTTTMAFSCGQWSAAGQGICQLTYQLNNQTATTTQTSIDVSQTYNTTTNSINLTWTDPAGNTNTVQTTVIKQTYSGTTTLCNETQTGASGVVGCPTSGYTGAVLVTVTQNNAVVTSQYIELNATSLGSHLDPYEGAFWAAMITIVCFGFGVAVSPAAGVIAVMVGLIAIYALGISSAVTLTFLIIAGVVGIAVGWRLRT